MFVGAFLFLWRVEKGRCGSVSKKDKDAERKFFNVTFLRETPQTTLNIASLELMPRRPHSLCHVTEVLSTYEVYI